MATEIKVKRGTRAQLEAAKAADDLVQGEPYLITDENRLAVGVSADNYESFAKQTHTHAISDTTSLQTTLDGIQTSLASKQATLVSGTNIKTIGGETLMGSGNIILPSSLIDMIQNAPLGNNLTEGDFIPFVSNGVVYKLEVKTNWWLPTPWLIPTPTPTPVNFGDALDGGFYAGMIWSERTVSSTSMVIETGTKAFAVTDMHLAPCLYVGQSVEVRSRANPTNHMKGTVTSATTATSVVVDVTAVSGSGTFTDWSIMSRHRVIVAPKVGGEHAGIAMKNTNTAFPAGCYTLTEGLTATNAMRNADTSTVYPAAHWVRSLEINGRNDWHIPARDALELCWRNLKPVTTNNYTALNRDVTASQSYMNRGSYGDIANTHGLNNNSSPTGTGHTASVPGQTTATAFQTGGAEAFEFGSDWYWSSTEHSAGDAWSQGWLTSMGPGRQQKYSKSSLNRVRAVRRSII